MIVGLLRCECFIANAQSLKDKRRVIKSVLERAKNRFNIAASEVGGQDVWQRTTLAFVTVSSSKKIADAELQNILTIIDQNDEIECVSIEWEWL